MLSPGARRRLRSMALVLPCCGLAVRALPAQPTSQTTADLVLVHGTILTVDATDSIAQAIAIRGGKILRVGADAEILSLATPSTRVIDLKGATATPGLIDSHGHFADGGLAELYHLDLSDATSIAEVQRRVRERARSLKPGEWLEGDGWDEGKFAERRYIYAADLDAASPANPVWLTHTTGHYGAANSVPSVWPASRPQPPTLPRARSIVDRSACPPAF